VAVGGAAKTAAKRSFDPDQPQVRVEEHEAHRGLPEHRLGGGQIGLDLRSVATSTAMHSAPWSAGIT